MIDKLYKKYIGLVIIIVVAISISPIIIENITGIQKELQVLKNINVISNVEKYINSKPDYYFNYEGAVYCIKVQELIDSNIISKDKIEINPNNIIEAKYTNGKYEYNYNNECIEK